jgi:hypothetical protein
MRGCDVAIPRHWLPRVSAAIGSLIGAGAAFGLFWAYVANGAYDGGSFAAISDAYGTMVLMVGGGIAVGVIGGFLVGHRLVQRNP